MATRSTNASIWAFRGEEKLEQAIEMVVQIFKTKPGSNASRFGVCISMFSFFNFCMVILFFHFLIFLGVVILFMHFPWCISGVEPIPHTYNKKKQGPLNVCGMAPYTTGGK